MAYDEGVHPRVKTRLDCPTPGPRRPFVFCVVSALLVFGALWVVLFVEVLVPTEIVLP